MESIVRNLRERSVTILRRFCGVGLVLLLGPASGAYAEERATGDYYECLIEPHVDVSISSPVTGVVERVRVKRGAVVKKGQTLVDLVAGIERASFDLAKARSEFAERTNARNAELVDERLISSNEKDALETDALLARLEMREALEVLKLRTIRSPIAGVVADVSVEAGEFVNENEMMRIAQIDPLNVEVVVPVSLYGRIKEGSRGEVRPETPFEGVFEAEVVIVDRVVDAASGTFGLRLELPNPKGRLPAGLKCRVSFPGI
jgi:RND family efflux transporter MFP subunit